MKPYKTRLEAARAWVREFNAIPQSVVCKLMQLDEDEVYEVTPPSVGDAVFVFGSRPDDGVIESTKKIDDLMWYTIRLSNGVLIELTLDDFCIDPCEQLPMWGTMWAFSDPTDQEWIDGYLGNHLQEMADCGFRIYQQEDYGYIFGIDGAGYDFFEQHWIPLYKARGLRWSEEDEKDDGQ